MVAPTRERSYEFRVMNLLRKYVMHTPHPSRLCRDTFPRGEGLGKRIATPACALARNDAVFAYYWTDGVCCAPHPSRLCRDTVPVAVPGALLGANACVAHRPQPLAQAA